MPAGCLRSLRINASRCAARNAKNRSGALAGESSNEKTNPLRLAPGCTGFSLCPDRFREGVFDETKPNNPQNCGFHFRDTSIWRAQTASAASPDSWAEACATVRFAKTNPLNVRFPRPFRWFVPAPLSPVCHASRIEAIARSAPSTLSRQRERGHGTSRQFNQTKPNSPVSIRLSPSDSPSLKGRGGG